MRQSWGSSGSFTCERTGMPSKDQLEADLRKKAEEELMKAAKKYGIEDHVKAALLSRKRKSWN